MTKGIINPGIKAAVVCWCLTVGYMGIIFYLSSLHGLRLPHLVRHADKIVHMFAYIPLALLFYISLRKSGMRKYVLLTAFCCTAVYGISDEVHQFYVAGRDASIGDFIADMAGALIGSAGGGLIKT